MKKKITALLLMLGCVLGVGTMAACAQDDQDKPTMCEHTGVEYILAEIDDKDMLQIRMNCDGCMGICFEDVKKSDCEKTVTPPTCDEDGDTVYSYEKEGKTYTSKPLEIVEKLGHDLEASLSTDSGKTICKDGATKTEICRRAGCDYSKKTEIPAEGHYFGDWSVVTDPAFEAEGELTHTCNAYKNTIINGVAYIGCGEAETKKIPALNKKDYTTKILEGQQICGKYGKSAFIIKVDGQSFTFEGDFLTKRHVMGINDGEPKAMDPYEIIMENDPTYDGKWSFLAGEKSDCTKLNGAHFTCADCEEEAPLTIKTPHKKPETGVIIDPILDCRIQGKVKYTCTMCEQPQEEVMQHAYTYTLTVTGDTYVLEGVCANCPTPDNYSGNISELSQKKKDPTCAKDGWIEYSYKRGGITLAKTVVTVSNIGVQHVLSGKKMDLSLVYNYPDHKGIEYVDNGKYPSCAEEGKEAKGLFYCDACKEPVAVKIRIGHTWEVINETPSSCEGGGEIERECKYCSKHEVLPKDKLGHDWKYTYMGKTTEKYKFTKECQHEGCVQSGLFEIDREECKVKGLDKNKPICQQSGKLQISFKDENKNVIVVAEVAKTAHICLGVEKPYVDDNNSVIIYKLEGGIEYLGCTDGMKPCEEGSEAEGCFYCEACGKLVDVKVEVEHTKPDNLASDATEFDCVVCGKKEIIS